VKKNGERKAFHVGSNSSCRQHIRSHYELYRERCLKQEIQENHHSVPRAILKQRDAALKMKGPQQNLDGIVQKQSRVKEFSRRNVLHAVAEFVVCDDQVRDCIDGNIS
jgi:hypothetical protein